MIVLTCFGTVWYALADLVISPTVAIALAVAVPGIVVLVLLLRGASRLRARMRAQAADGDDDGSDDGRRRADGRRFALINAVQWVAIVLAVVAANVLHAPERIPSLIALIVGLHFFPLARLFRAPVYNLTAGAMCVAAVASFAMSGEVGAGFVTACGCAILWATAAYVLRAASRWAVARNSSPG